MAKSIPITQNPERYRQRDRGWQISASPALTPVSLQIGPALTNIKPVLSVDGIIVRVGDWHLCSEGTLTAIRESDNPHYSIESNGSVSVKGKSVGMGASIRIIDLDITALKGTGESLDYSNRKAGVSYVDYIWEGDAKDGVPVNLIRQIDYTLNPTISRPSDKYGLHSMDLGDADTVYSIDALNTETAQSDGVLDKSKLETFLKNLQNRLIILRSDFNMIKDVFYNGTLPESKVTIDFDKIATTGVQTDAGDEPPVLFKYTRLAEVVAAPVSTPVSGSAGTTPTTSDGAPASGQPAQPPQPPVIQLRMRKKRDLKANTIPVWENDPTAGDKGARKRLIKEGDVFWGYFFKDWSHGQKVWVVYEADKTTIVGWGVADRNDFVDPI